MVFYRLDLKTCTQSCALRKVEGSPRLWTFEIQGAQYMICVKIAKICWSPMRPPSTVRAHICTVLLHIESLSVFYIFVNWCCCLLVKHRHDKSHEEVVFRI